ncbi:MAG TPA: hypothetical protein VML94_07730 [Thermoplasmata archaeon]|nr:hypothetical protein [Thermoplasmata archaeon]
MAALSFGRKAVVATALIALVLAASSAVVMAGPLAPHARPAAPTSGGGIDWGRHTPTFPVTFNETGLPAGTNWSVSIFGDTARWGYHTNGSSTSAIGFSLPNGTYGYTVANTSNATSVYTAFPSSGNLSVNGSAVSVSVAFAAELLYDVVFVESGLPTGTFWSVELSASQNGSWVGGGNGSWSPFCFGITYWNGSATTVVAFSVPAGSYSFSVSNVTNGSALYVPTPSSGNVTVNGTGVTVDVAFATVPLYNVTFDETGLPNGTLWAVAISGTATGWDLGVSSNATIGFVVPDGTYDFSVVQPFYIPLPVTAGPLCSNGTGNGSAFGGRYVPTPESGNVTVAGSDVTVGISFAPVTYSNVTFVETGLPNGTVWSVTLTSQSTEPWGTAAGPSAPAGGEGFHFNASGTNEIGFTVLGGTYDFTVGNVSFNGTLYTASPTVGNVSLNGTTQVVNVTFSAVALYNLTFAEAGLPNGSLWFVELTGASSGSFYNLSGGSSLSFEVPNGTYNFTVYAYGFVWVSPLPLCVNGSTLDQRYVATPAAGSVAVAGTSEIVSIAFALETFYSVSFVESGLPNGTFWTVAVDGVAGVGGIGPWAVTPLSWGGNGSGGWPFNFSTISVSLPNGTYPFTVGNVTLCNGTLFVPTPASGTVTVDGSNVTVSIVFADPPAGGHSTAPSARPASSLPPLGASAAVAAGAAVLALLGAVALIARRRPPRPSTPIPTEPARAPEDGTGPQGPI